MVRIFELCYFDMFWYPYHIKITQFKYPINFLLLPLYSLNWEENHFILNVGPRRKFLDPPPFSLPTPLSNQIHSSPIFSPLLSRFSPQPKGPRCQRLIWPLSRTMGLLWGLMLAILLYGGKGSWKNCEKCMH